MGPNYGINEACAQIKEARQPFTRSGATRNIAELANSGIFCSLPRSRTTLSQAFGRYAVESHIWPAPQTPIDGKNDNIEF